MMRVSRHNEPAYITKRLLVRTSLRAAKIASEKAMRIAGHVVKVQNEWVVREYEDGRTERILKLAPKVKPQEIILD